MGIGIYAFCPKGITMKNSIFAIVENMHTQPKHTTII